MTRGLQGYTQGGEGYLGIRIMWRPDDTTDPYAFDAPEQFLLAETKSLDQAYVHIEHDAFVGSRDTDKGHRHGKATAGGPFTLALYKSNGADVWEAAFGFKGHISAIAADTTTAIQNGPMSPPAAPTTTPSSSGGTLPAGEYEYAVTFGTVYGETPLGTPSAGDVLSGATSSDALSVIPTGPAGTTFRGIYRSKDDGPFTKVHTVADNTTTTWTDTGAAAGTSVLAPPAAPVSTPSGSGGTLPSGDYVFGVTFVEPAGETNLGELTATDTLSGTTSSDALSVIPLGPTGTTARKIYARYTPTSLVAASPAPTTTQFAVTAASGSKFKRGAATVAATPVFIQSVVGDLVTLKAPLAVAPTAGDAVAQVGTFELIHTLADNTTASYSYTAPAAPAAVAPSVNTSVPVGVSILALSAGDANYAVPSKGRPVAIDDGVNQELRLVLDYDTTNKYLFVALLGERDGRTITHSTSGTTVTALACDLERFIAKTDFSHDQSNLLPFIAVEDNVAGSYSWQYRGGLIGKLDLKAAAAKTTVTADVMFNKPRQLANGEGPNPSPTAFDDTDASLEDLSFEYQDGFLAIECDPDSTQVPMLQRMDDGVSWELNLNNNLKEEGPMDGTAVKRFLPGAKRKLDVKLNMLNKADYPPIYQDFVSRDKDAQFFAHFAQNEGTETSPSWRVRAFYLPHVRYVKSTEVHGLTDTKGENVEGVARRANGQEKIYSYSISS